MDKTVVSTRREPLTRVDLDKHRCSVPGCESGHEQNARMSMYSFCHPSAACRIAYEPETGCLLVACHACGLAIAAIQVAGARPS